MTLSTLVTDPKSPRVDFACDNLPMDHCDECGFTYADHATEQIVAYIRDLGGRYQAVLTAPTADEARLSSRPAPDVWSPVEYGCHVISRNSHTAWAAALNS